MIITSHFMRFIKGGQYMKTIVVDFENVKYLMEMHQLLKKTFELPDYYGSNMDALWDCLNCSFNEPVSIKLQNLKKLPESLHESVSTMLDVFKDLEKENEEITLIID